MLRRLQDATRLVGLPTPRSSIVRCRWQSWLRVALRQYQGVDEWTSPGEIQPFWYRRLSLIAIRLRLWRTGMNRHNCGEAGAQPVEIRLSRGKHNLDGHSLDDFREIA